MNYIDAIETCIEEKALGIRRTSWKTFPKDYWRITANGEIQHSNEGAKASTNWTNELIADDWEVVYEQPDKPQITENIRQEINYRALGEVLKPDGRIDYKRILNSEYHQYVENLAGVIDMAIQKFWENLENSR